MMKEILVMQMNAALPVEDFYVICNGKLIVDNEAFIPGQKYQLVPRLIGGKGGFGSMLRAIGAQIEKTTNREACRDLRGRRMRDVNNEKKLREWGEKIGERESEKMERRRLKRERIKNRGTMHKFEDEKYDQQKVLIKQNMEEALQEALSNSKYTSGKKGKLKRKEKKVFGDEISDYSSESEIEENDKKIRKLEGSGKSKIESTITEESSCSSVFIIQDVITQDQMNTNGTTLTQDMITQDTIDSNGTSLNHEIKSTTKIMNIESRYSNTLDMSTSSCDQVMNTLNRSSDLDDTASIKNDISMKSSNTLIIGNLSTDATMPSLCDYSNQDNHMKSQCTMELINVEISSSSHTTLSSSEDREPIDLSRCTSVACLETLGLDVLKKELTIRGLKCGGTLVERAARLFSIKGLEQHQIPANLLTKKNK